MSSTNVLPTDQIVFPISSKKPFSAGGGEGSWSRKFRDVGRSTHGSSLTDCSSRNAERSSANMTNPPQTPVVRIGAPGAEDHLVAPRIPFLPPGTSLQSRRGQSPHGAVLPDQSQTRLRHPPLPAGRLLRDVLRG